MGTKKFIPKANIDEVMSEVYLDTHRRFIKHLPSKPRCAEHLDNGTHIRHRDDALLYPYIQINQHRKSYIILDVDIKRSAYLWSDLDMPEPTIICVSPATTHCHYFYELFTGVLFTKSNLEENNYSKDAQNLYKATRNSLMKKIGGDTSYAGHLAKNPFHPFWVTKWTDVRYKLRDFEDYIDIDWSCFKSKSEEESDFDLSKRNKSIFDFVRKLTYEIVTPDISYDIIYQFAYENCDQINQSLPEKLPPGEIRTISASITKFCYKNRTRLSTKKQKEILSTEEIKFRQQNAAANTNEKQKNDTKEKIEQCIYELKKNGKKINTSIIAKNIGKSRSHLNTHYSSFINELK